MVAASLVDADYYRAPYEGGAGFLAVFDSPSRAAIKTDPLSICRVLRMAMCDQTQFDPVPMTKAFFQKMGYGVTMESNKLIGTSHRGTQVHVEFDEAGYFKQVSGKVGAADLDDTP